MSQTSLPGTWKVYHSYVTLIHVDPFFHPTPMSCNYQHLTTSGNSELGWKPSHDVDVATPQVQKVQT